MKAIRKALGNATHHNHTHLKPLERETPVDEESFSIYKETSNPNLGKESAVNTPSIGQMNSAGSTSSSSMPITNNVSSKTLQTESIPVTKQTLPTMHTSTSTAPIFQTSKSVQSSPIVSDSTLAHTSTSGNTTITRIEKTPIVLETIKHEQIEEIQPIIQREIEKTEVKKIIQPLYDQEIRTTAISEMNLPESDATVTGGLSSKYKELLESEDFKAGKTVRIEKEPIIIETHRTVVIEEFHPVIYREVVHPQYVKTMVPMSERSFFQAFGDRFRIHQGVRSEQEIYYGNKSDTANWKMNQYTNSRSYPQQYENYSNGIQYQQAYRQQQYPIQQQPYYANQYNQYQYSYSQPQQYDLQLQKQREREYHLQKEREYQQRYTQQPQYQYQYQSQSQPHSYQQYREPRMESYYYSSERSPSYNNYHHQQYYNNNHNDNYINNNVDYRSRSNLNSNEFHSSNTTTRPKVLSFNQRLLEQRKKQFWQERATQPTKRF